MVIVLSWCLTADPDHFWSLENLIGKIQFPLGLSALRLIANRISMKDGDI
jgi:hypothetical protein